MNKGYSFVYDTNFIPILHFLHVGGVTRFEKGSVIFPPSGPR